MRRRNKRPTRPFSRFNFLLFLWVYLAEPCLTLAARGGGETPPPRRRSIEMQTTSFARQGGRKTDVRTDTLQRMEKRGLWRWAREKKSERGEQKRENKSKRKELNNSRGDRVDGVCRENIQFLEGTECEAPISFPLQHTSASRHLAQNEVKTSQPSLILNLD